MTQLRKCIVSNDPSTKLKQAILERKNGAIWIEDPFYSTTGRCGRRHTFGRSERTANMDSIGNLSNLNKTNVSSCRSQVKKP